MSCRANVFDAFQFSNPYQQLCGWQQAADGLLADASDEFGSVAAVKAQLESVKVNHADVYRDAYLGDSAPALFAPFVRLQLLVWDPLYAPGDGALTSS